jgi:hypothetical protein
MAGSASITGRQNYVFGIGHPAIQPSGEVSPSDSVQVFETAGRTLTVQDMANLIVYNSGSGGTFTVPTDSVLELDLNSTTSANIAGTFAIYQSGAGAPLFAAGAGVTLRGTAPTFAQYGPPKGLVRVGVNEWAYIG